MPVTTVAIALAELLIYLEVARAKLTPPLSSRAPHEQPVSSCGHAAEPRRLSIEDFDTEHTNLEQTLSAPTAAKHGLAVDQSDLRCGQPW